MDRQAIKALLKEVLGPNTPMTDHTKWVSISCPFAPWTHASGRDANPSAGVSIKPEGTSIFNCQACHTALPLSAMLKQLGKYNGEDYSDMLGGVETEEFFGGNLKPWGVKPERDEARLPPPLEDHYLDLYDPVEDHWYLEYRGLTPETGAALDLKIDPKDSGGEERILFPVYHHKGGFYGFTGRATADDAYPPIRDYHGLPKMHLLLGSHLLPDDAKYVIVVEGLFDQAKLFQYGQPVVAQMGGSLTEHQINALIDIALPVYFFKDNDAAGELGQKALKESKLCRHLPVMKIRYPSRKVKGRDGKPRPVKDPDELRPEEVEAMVEDARLL